MTTLPTLDITSSDTPDLLPSSDFAPLEPAFPESPAPSVKDSLPIPTRDDAWLDAPAAQKSPPSPTTAPTTNAKTADDRSSTRSCPHSNSGKRNLVVCIDGTANQFSVKNTNIVELYSNLAKNDDQLTYYNSGIGTYAKPAYMSLGYIIQRIDHTIDMMVAWNFKRIVLSAYQWLSENYREGDRIFLFGFSRGAYQVRVIAGMIHLVGLLHKGNNDQIAFAFELYTSITDVTDRAQKPMNKTSADLCQRFKETLCRPNVTVHFVGAWDTVSSIGIVRGRSLPETNTGMQHVCAFRHALALDERRVKFLPEYSNGGIGPDPSDSSKGDVKEVWFAGSHSDIGGGNTENMDLDKFGPALRWMIYEGINHGLKILSPSSAQSRAISVDSDPTGTTTVQPESKPQADAATDPPHQGTPGAKRKIDEVLNEFPPIYRFIIISLQFAIVAVDWIAWGSQYLWGAIWAIWAELLKMAVRLRITTLKPGAAPKDPSPNKTQATLWSTIDRPSESLRGVWWILEVLPYVWHLTYEDKDSTTPQQHLGQPRVVQPGQFIHESVIEAMTRNPPNLYYEPYALIHDSMRWIDMKAQQQRIEEDPYASAGPLLAALEQGKGDVSEPDINVLERLTSTPAGIRSIVESPNSLGVLMSALEDAQHPISNKGAIAAMIKALSIFPFQSISSRKYTYAALNRIFDRAPSVASAVCTDVLRLIGKWPFYGHRGDINSVAVSRDGTRIASASDDGTIRIWDAKTGEICGAPLMGHTDSVMSVAFSPDGSQLVSGSVDDTVRVWNVQTGQEDMAPLRGHTSWVRSVAFSQDGTRIVSGADYTVRVWDAKTGGTAMEPLDGHTSLVLSVAFSPDGHLIVSGSMDNTIRIWNAGTGEQALPPLEGHSDDVNSVAFSPDGGHIVSGSDDGTIRIWDVSTGELVKVLRGLSSIVWSVTYSPNGARIASGSDDRMIRIWDARSGEEIKKLMGHANSVRSVAVTPDGERIVSGSDDKTIRVWDMATGEQVLGPVDGWDDEEST
ncbi:hypothetical protein HGRIS_005542 [Hohenbuehelia grisea]|uniref:T6SS Phospholipase effector Tle1-like catalytic domain-containing protein n=1 Tax=Hohenbuehelia grisea TaxID=104357 RepID=A0ABR3JY20_9AGAR